MRGSILIKNVKLLTPQGLTTGNIKIDDGVVTKIGKTNGNSDSKKLEGGGRLALPGLIDAHVHLRGLDLAYKEDFYTGTCAAAVGGFTTVLDMPNTQPPTNSIKNLELKIRQVRSESVVNVGFHAMPPLEDEEIDKLLEKGARSFKLYLGDERYLHPEFIDERLPVLALKCNKKGIPLTVHAEDPAKLKTATRNYKNAVFTVKTFTSIHSPEVESDGVKLICNKIEKTSIHICHLSCKPAIEEFQRCKAIRGKITAEASPHHIFLSEKHLDEFKGFALTNPPLRNPTSRNQLWKAVVNGDIDIIASDHAPHSMKEKSQRNLREVLPGIPGLETTLPLMLTEVNKGSITITKLVELLAKNPAKIFNLKNKGFLQEGMDGDLTIVDLKTKHMIDPSRFYSKAKYTPFKGFNCIGKAWAVIVMGQIVMKEGEMIAEKGCGNIIAGI